MAYPKLHRLVHMLSDLTETGRLDWRETAEPGTYRVAMAGGAVTIRQERGDQVQYFHLMRDIYCVARRQACGGDAVLDKILLEMEKTSPLS